MEVFKIKPTGKRTVEFEGDELGYARREVSTGIKISMTLYKTKGEQYVLQSNMITQWQGDDNTVNIYVSKDLNKIYYHAVEVHNHTADDLFDKCELEDKIKVTIE
jgi:hypothetical protein